MTTEVTFETATLADAVKRASRVAPSKAGQAFDKSAGIIMDIFPDEESKCVLRSTDITVFLSEIVGVLNAEGKEVRWRLPSMVLANIIGSLPITSGKTVTIKQDGEKVIITSGRMRGTLILMDPTYYPSWDMFDPTEMTTVNGLGGRIAQVEWAADSKSQPPLCGIYLSGEHAIATDRYRIARAACGISLASPVTIPAGVLGDVLRPMGDVRIGVEGSTLQVAVDDYTQFQTVIYDTQYPANQLKGIMVTEYPEMIELRKQHLLDVINRSTTIVNADRSPLLKLFIGREEIAAMMQSAETGVLGDVVETPGSATHARVTISFSPKNLTDALSRCPNDMITVGYDPDKLMMPLYINGGSGYEAWIAPRKDIKSE